MVSWRELNWSEVIERKVEEELRGTIAKIRV
jgi:hypothetical protein